MSSYGIREGSGPGEWIMGAVTRNPEGLLLLAAGCALLMRSGRGLSDRRSYAEAPPKRQGEYSGQQGPGVGERVGEAARRAGEYVSEATDKMSETARSYASSAAEYADEATRAATERSRRMADQARDTADYVVREQPWAVALTGLVAGAAVASLFPPTTMERRTLGEVGGRLRSAAGSMGEQLMEAGMQAGERLSEVAEERGLTSEGLKDAAREVGETFSSALTGEAAPQTAKRKQAGEGPGSRAENLAAQPGAGGTHSSKSNAPIPPSGGRR